MNVLELIENVVINKGENIAYECNGIKLTYNRLWDLSDRLAKWILGKYGCDKTPIVVYGHKSPLQLICFLATVKSGRAYCPIDSSMPLGRVKDIIHKVDGELVLATEPIEVEEDIIIGKDIIELILSLDDNEVTNMDRSWLKAKWVKEDDDFYIIFTSGTTGKPKGVEITMNNLTGFVKWFGGVSCNIATGTQKEAQKTYLNQAPYAFDLSVMDTYTALTLGEKIYAVDKKAQLDLNLLLEKLKLGKINCWVSTPSFAAMCLGDKDFNGETLSDLEAMFFCGERLGLDTVRSLMERFPKVKIVNTYGPTESTVAISAVEITKEMADSNEELPVGKVREGTKVIISPEGEILILGNTVAKGYYKDEERTLESFTTLADEENKGKNKEEKAYRTGDRGAILNGLLYCHGRIDNQIKFHGYRMELGDIESNLMEIEGVKEAVVLPRIRKEVIKNLVAFLVIEGSGDYAKGQEIREELKHRLPDYMVPKKINFIEKMPLTNNGKIDRKALEGEI